MTEPEHRLPSASAATPSPQPSPASDDPPRARRWWKTPAGGVAAAALVVGLGVSGYFAVNAVLAHEPPSAAPNTLAQVPGLPPGAAACAKVYNDSPVPFNAGARGTPTTSCPFVEQVRRVFSAQHSASIPTDHISAISPATSKWYDLACIPTGSYVTCTGGAAAVIYLYNQSPGSPLTSNG